MLDSVSNLERAIDMRNIEETRRAGIRRLFGQLDRQRSLENAS